MTRRSLALPLVAALLSSCRREAPRDPSPETVILQARPAPASHALQRQRPGNCTTEACLFELIPIDTAPRFPAAACDALLGRAAREEPAGAEDLGLLCRLRLARAKASSRAQAPCVSQGRSNPDFDASKREELRLGVYSDLLRSRHLKARGIRNRHGRSASISTIHDTFRHSTGFTDGEQKTLTADTYFCLSGEPAHYVPYFFALTEEVTTDPTPEQKGRRAALVLEAIEASPAPPPHIVHQLENIDDSDLEVYALADVNGDGVDDLVMFDERSNPPRYALRACLFDVSAEQCRLLETDPELKAAESLVHPRMQVERGHIVTRLTSWRADETLAQASFEVRGGRLERVPAQ